MSLSGKYYSSNIILYLIFVLVIAANSSKTSGDANDRSINADYWGTPELRSRKPTCDRIMRILCSNKCGKDYICENDECNCKENNKSFKISVRSSEDNKFYQDNRYIYSKEYDIPEVLRTAIQEDTKSHETETEPEDPKLEDKIDQPIEQQALRHHIAHFCPSLKEARACIRRCMELGKPAFCGKDHVCYCGHKHTSHDDKKKDVIDVYSQYRDIYEKYFGPQIFKEHVDSDE